MESMLVLAAVVANMSVAHNSSRACRRQASHDHQAYFGDRLRHAGFAANAKSMAPLRRLRLRTGYFASRRVVPTPWPLHFSAVANIPAHVQSHIRHCSAIPLTHTKDRFTRLYHDSRDLHTAHTPWLDTPAYACGHCIRAHTLPTLHILSILPAHDKVLFHRSPFLR